MESNSRVLKEVKVETLTEMLREDATGFNSEDAGVIKGVVQEWLRGVGLPPYYSMNRDGIAFDTTESIRRLLVVLVDEPRRKSNE